MTPARNGPPARTPPALHLWGTLGVVIAFSWSSPSPAADPITLPTEVRLREGFRVPPPAGLEARVIADAVDGKLDQVDLLTAALVASGVADERVSLVHQRVLGALEIPRSLGRAAQGPLERGRVLLRALHGNVLRRYVERQSSISVVIETGEFNCLSATVLFVVAADGLLDQPRGMISKTHAFARVDIEGGAVDVETTTPLGFAVDRASLLTPAYLAQLGFVDGSDTQERAAGLKNPEEVAAAGLVAGLYSNRGVQLVREGDLEGAAIAFDRATRLSRGEQRARAAEWRATLFGNATRALVDEGRLDDARALLAFSLADMAPGPARESVLHNLGVVAVAQGERALRADDPAGARSFFVEAMMTGALSSTTRSQLERKLASIDGRLLAERGADQECGSLPTTTAQVRCFMAATLVWERRNQPGRALFAARHARALDEQDGQVAGRLYNALLAQIKASDAAGDCAHVEALVREAENVRRTLQPQPIFSAPRVMGACWWGLGDRAAGAGQDDVAVAHYERARVHLPDDDGLRNNLVAMQMRMATPLVDALRCDEARPLVARANALFVGSGPSPTALLVACANLRAQQAARQKDWPLAVVELRRGMLDAPTDPILRENLGTMLHNVVVDHLDRGRCDDARGFTEELAALGRSATVMAVQRACSSSSSSPAKPMKREKASAP